MTSTKPRQISARKTFMKKTDTPSALRRSEFLKLLLLGAPAAALPRIHAGKDIPVPSPSPAFDEGKLRGFIELARSDLRNKKALIIAENISFTADEAAEFWPLHREYNLALGRLFDRRYALIKDYANHYNTMTDEVAERLMKEAFKLEEDRVALRKKYFKKMKRIVPIVKAVRFFQLDNQLNMVIDLQIAAALPLIQ